VRRGRGEGLYRCPRPVCQMPWAEKGEEEEEEAEDDRR